MKMTFKLCKIKMNADGIRHQYFFKKQNKKVAVLWIWKLR
jgi:hypothetical protein